MITVGAEAGGDQIVTDPTSQTTFQGFQESCFVLAKHQQARLPQNHKEMAQKPDKALGKNAKYKKFGPKNKIYKYDTEMEPENDEIRRPQALKQEKHRYCG